MDEVAKYRKKKPQNSKASKRADHKHQYEKSITMHTGLNGNQPPTFYWSTHCSVCGRRGDFSLDNDDFRKPEYKGKALFWCGEMCLPKEVVFAMYPDIPVYTNIPNTFREEERIR